MLARAHTLTGLTLALLATAIPTNNADAVLHTGNPGFGLYIREAVGWSVDYPNNLHEATLELEDCNGTWTIRQHHNSPWSRRQQSI